MTTEEIDRQMIPFTLAKEIRRLLDGARAQYGEDWDEDEVEKRISELVFEE